MALYLVSSHLALLISGVAGIQMNSAAAAISESQDRTQSSKTKRGSISFGSRASRPSNLAHSSHLELQPIPEDTEINGEDSEPGNPHVKRPYRRRGNHAKHVKRSAGGQHIRAAARRSRSDGAVTQSCCGCLQTDKKKKRVVKNRSGSSGAKFTDKKEVMAFADNLDSYRNATKGGRVRRTSGRSASCTTEEEVMKFADDSAVQPQTCSLFPFLGRWFGDDQKQQQQPTIDTADQ